MARYLNMLDSVKSLVLNFSYEPLQFCSAKRAIIMVLNGRAEFLESDGYSLFSIREICIPLLAVHL